MRTLLRLKADGITAGPDFWDAVRANRAIFSDVREWWPAVNGPVTPVIESPQLIETARAAAAGAMGR
jgi:hypothetical protein